MTHASILVVETEAETRNWLLETLEGDGRRCESAENEVRAQERIDSHAYDAVVWDTQAIDMARSEVLSSLVRASRDSAMVLLIAPGVHGSAVEALARGVADCVSKPVDALVLRTTVARAVERQRLQRENLRLKAAAPAAMPNGWPTLAELEARYVNAVLAKTEGNRTEAARILGVNRRTVQRLVARGKTGRTR